MARELDNKKMWASILKHTTVSWIGTLVKKSLKDQGLQYNPETKEIESIEPEPFMFKANNYYVNIEALSNYTIGKVYCCLVDNLLESDIDIPQHVQMLTEYFRPATEREILQDSQRIVSAKAKEALLRELSQSEVTKKSDQDELTDFEKMLAECINNAQGNILPPEHMAASWSHELLEEARKQLQPEFDEEIEQAYKNQDEVVYNRGYDKGYNEAIEDACEWLYENLINYWSQACTDNCDFIEDFRNALEKGGEL